MASINYGAREISVKIVYYGPGLSGKTTNLQVIHRKIPTEYRSDMVSLATETDRTLFFDFLPLDLGKIKGFTTKFQLYTVPGQVYYNATRKLVLRGVDGVVFVVDSGADKLQENLESFHNLEENLAEYGYQRENIPIILQYNKRDLPNASAIEELERTFNKYRVPFNEAVAARGVGVFESLKLIGKIVLDHLNKKYNRQGAPATAPSAPAPAPAAPQPPPVARAVPPPPPAAPSPVSHADAFDPFAEPVRPGSQHAPTPPPSFVPPQPGPAQTLTPQATAENYFDYGSIKLESMDQSKPALNQQPAMQQPAQPSRSDLDIEIEKYRREIEQRQQPQAPAPQLQNPQEQRFAPQPQMQQPQQWQQPAAQQQFAPQQPMQYAPQAPQNQQWQQQPAFQQPSFQQPAFQQPAFQQQQYQPQMQQPPQQWQQPQMQQPAQRGAENDYSVYNFQPPAPSTQPHTPQTAPMPQHGGPAMFEQRHEETDDALFFTSVNTDARKKPKKPVNPKAAPKQGIFSKLFNRNNS